MLKFAKSERKDKTSVSSNECVTYEGGEYKRTVYRQNSYGFRSPTKSEYRNAILHTLEDVEVRHQILPENQQWSMRWRDGTPNKYFADHKENYYVKSDESSDLHSTFRGGFYSSRNTRRKTNSASSIESSMSELTYGAIQWRKPEVPSDETKGLTAVDIAEHFSPVTHRKLKKWVSDFGYYDTSPSYSSGMSLTLNNKTTSESTNASCIMDDNESLSSNDSLKLRQAGLFRFSGMRKQVKRVCRFERKKKSTIKTELKNMTVPTEESPTVDECDVLNVENQLPTHQHNNNDASPSLSAETPKSSSTSFLNSDRSFSDESDVTNTYKDVIRRVRRKSYIHHTIYANDGVKEKSYHNKSISFAKKCTYAKTKSSGENICSLKSNLLLKIFYYLPTPDVCRLSLVCQKWHQLYLSTELWSSIVICNMPRSNIDGILNLLLQRLAFTSPYACLCVKTVRLDGCVQLTDDGLNYIAMRCPELKSIETASCIKVTGVGVEKMLLQCPNMAYMNLAGCDGISNFSFFPSSGMTFGKHASFLEMRYVDFSECTSLSNAALKKFALCAGFLEFLYLRRCDSISNEGIEAVARNCANLKEISLNDCYNVSDAGIKILVKYCTHLRYISLAKCAITDQSITNVAKYSRQLRHLNLHECEIITERGIIDFCNSCEKLRSLDVSRCNNVTDMTLYALARCKRLRRLCMKKCSKVSDAGLRKIATHCQRLRHLNIHGCNFTYETYVYIKQRCKMCTIEHNRVDFC